MNFAQCLFRFYRDLGEPNQYRFPIDLVTEWFDEGCTLINSTAPTIEKSLDIDLVSGQVEYSVPYDLLDRKIIGVYFSDTIYTERRRLKPTTLEILYNDYRTWQDMTGDPTHWFFNNATNKIGFFPIPDSSLSGLTQVRYFATHIKMDNIYTTGTVAVTNGSTDVTGTSTAFIGNTFSDDEFGVGKLFPTSTVSFPKTFYTISADPLLDTALVLSDDYAGPTGSGQSYITCSPSPFTSDELTICAVTYAKGMAKLKDKETEYGVTLRAEAISRAKKFYRQYERDAISMDRIQMPNKTHQEMLRSHHNSTGSDY